MDKHGLKMVYILIMKPTCTRIVSAALHRRLPFLWATLHSEREQEVDPRVSSPSIALEDSWMGF